MKDGIHIPALVVRLVALGTLVGLAALIKAQMPEARRYLNIKSM